MTISIHRSRPLIGEFPIPGDKSISHRALMLSALSEGTSEIQGLLASEDIESTIACLRSLGIAIAQTENVTRIEGHGLHGFRPPHEALNVGNSGTTIRLLSGILAGQPFNSTLFGDDSLNKRPMKRIVDPLGRMGAVITASPGATAPLTIRGKRPLHAIEYQLPIPSAQVKSAVLLAGLFADGATTVIERIPSRDHTERMLGLVPEAVGSGRAIRIMGGMVLPARKYFVPADLSSALFFICAALLVPGSDIVLQDVGLNPSRTKALEILTSIGGQVVIEDERESSGEPRGTIRARFSRLEGSVTVHPEILPLVVDEIPVLAVTLALGGCSLAVRGGGDLRHKESDRITAIVTNLQSMGVAAEESADGFAFESKKTVFPTAIQTFGDHRIAMAFGIAGMALDGEMKIHDAEIASVSFPGFWKHINRFQQ